MRAGNMLSPRTGKPVLNQVVVYHKSTWWFVSYGTVIAKYNARVGKLWLDETYHNWSRTTSKYLHGFLRDLCLDKDEAIYKDLQ